MLRRNRTAAESTSSVGFLTALFWTVTQPFEQQLLSSCLKVFLVTRTMGGALSLNLHMPDDANIAHRGQGPGAIRKDPVAGSTSSKVPLANPLCAFVRMSALRPFPQHLVYPVVAVAKGLFTDHRAVVVGPSSDYGIEQPNDRGLFGRLVRIQDALDFP